MTELVEFIEARLTEDEQGALNTLDRDWRPAGANSCEVYAPREVDSNRTIAWCRNGHDDDFANALHIARHDPARVLREAAAKRGMVERAKRHQRWAENEQTAAFQALATASQIMLLFMAPVWSDHPDFRPEWTPENVVPGGDQ